MKIILFFFLLLPLKRKQIVTQSWKKRGEYEFVLEEEREEFQARMVGASKRFAGRDHEAFRLSH